MKQSSIDFLEANLLDLISFGDKEIRDNYRKLFTKAKEMHKQEVIDDYARGYIDGVAKNKITAEQYYNETYNIKS